jgi:hypothetical protein
VYALKLLNFFYCRRHVGIKAGTSTMLTEEFYCFLQSPQECTIVVTQLATVASVKIFSNSSLLLPFTALHSSYRQPPKTTPEM